MTPHFSEAPFFQLAIICWLAAMLRCLLQLHGCTPHLLYWCGVSHFLATHMLTSFVVAGSPCLAAVLHACCFRMYCFF